MQSSGQPVPEHFGDAFGGGLKHERREGELLMNDAMRQNFPIYFPLFFIAMWIAITTLLGFLSGWFLLMKTYPDRPETPLQSFPMQSGSMNVVGMRSALTLSPCPSGLRLGMMRLLGPFCRDFLVPWDEISIIRKERFYRKVAEFSFGRPVIGTLTVSADVADRLARSARSHWPESDLVTAEARSGAGSRIMKQWLLSTVLAATFFGVASLVILPRHATPLPILACILFPAIVFGLKAIVQYVRSKRS
jgi:hypothetical protein